MAPQETPTSTPLPAPREGHLATDPQVPTDLEYARAGQEFFTQRLQDLGGDDLRGPSLLPGWTRAHVIAHVGFNARALARLVDWAATGVENPMYESAEFRGDEINHGATLSDAQLRRLTEQEAGVLDAAWKHLPDARWTCRVKNAQGRSIPISESVCMRSRELWLHALDLNDGGSAHDIPTPVSRRILQDVLTTWASRDGLFVHVKAADADDELHPREVLENEAFTGTPDLRVTGSLPDLMMWATGRGRQGVKEMDSAGRETSAVPDAHRWL